MSVIIGIDNCATGGVVAISKHSGSIISRHVMPSMTVVRAGNPYSKIGSARTDKRFKEIDSYLLWKLLYKIDNPKKIIVYFEDCPDHANQSSTMRSMGISAGRVLATLEILGLTYRRVLPRDWQPVMLGKLKKGETKLAALNKSSELWPDENWLATSRSFVPHDGMIDAALIAEYGRTKNR